MNAPPADPEPELVKMAALARRSGVPAATIKHYLREGLLSGPARRSGRNMAWYDARLVDRIRAIKALQRDHFLPLGVIKEVLDGAHALPDEQTAATAIARVLSRDGAGEGRTRPELVALGVDTADLDLLEGLGLVTPAGAGSEARYSGDDLALLRVLGTARRVGIRADMLPTAILADYARAIRELVRVELSLFRAGVLPSAGDDLDRITEAATTLSEQLVVLIRRKLLLPTLGQMAEEARSPRRASKSGTRKPRRR